jgi:hypothetical protein
VDLDRFRIAFRKLEGRLQEATRSTRFKPPSNLATARIHFKIDSSDQGLLGEVLDLSVDGMKIAIEAGHGLTVDQICRVEIGDEEGECYSLLGNVRWVVHSSHIIVFGISLNSADCLEA